MAVSCVVLETLNPIRYSLVIHSFVTNKTNQNSSVSSPNQINAIESFLSIPALRSSYPYKMYFGAPVDELIDTNDTYLNQQISSLILKNEDAYLLQWKPKKNRVVVVLHSEANAEDILKAFFHGWVVGAVHLEENSQLPFEKTEKDIDIKINDWVATVFPDLLKEMQDVGWVTTNVELLRGSEWTAQWPRKLTHTKIE
jgi:hypothetical protein